jgi:APA family basic amino acid/polyamine antiporter
VRSRRAIRCSSASALEEVTTTSVKALVTPMAAVEDDGRGDLSRQLGIREATAIIVGGIIGSGIFMTPSIVARQVGTPALTLLVWVAAGALALCGALCYAELGASVPRTGGTYHFLRMAYGTPLIAFLFGWTFFFVDGTCAVASLATTFASYSGFFVGRWIPMTGLVVRALAVSAIAAVTIINYVGVRAGGRVQVVFTTLKIVALLAVIFAGLFIGGSWQNLHAIPSATVPAIPLGAGFATGMIGALFSYSGWSYTSYVAGEMKNPRRNIPLSIILGMGIVLVVYLGVNVAYLKTLPFADLQRSTLVASDVMQRVLGPKGAGFVAAAVMVSTFGAVNAVTLIYPRIALAMARDGYFFRSLSMVHPRFRTPGNAILVQGAVAAAFAIAGSFEQIVNYFAFIDYLFFALAVACVLILRRRFPLLPRPFKVWGYPMTPILFLGVSAWYLSHVLVQRFQESMVGIGVMLLGLPFYWHWARRRGASSTPGRASGT